MIPYSRQSISMDDIESVVSVLKSDLITQGSVVPSFEESVAEFCGARYAVATNSATSALHIACLALGVGSGDCVWTSPVTFVASANCSLYCGADVDFVDIDCRTYNLSVEALGAKLEQARVAGQLPKVVVAVHLAGQSCNMESIHALAIEYGFYVIEDASHAIGGTYKGAKIGSCGLSDITIFSFHPVKIITTGEGGMAVTNNLDLARRMARLRSHGITRLESEMTSEMDGPWYYEQIELGFNYRMTEFQAALGCSQLKRIDKFVSSRREVAAQYDLLLANTPVLLPWQDPDCKSTFHLYIVRLKLDQVTNSHRQVFERMRGAGVGVNLHYIPVYRHPYYESLGFRPENFPEAERYYAEALSLPIYPGLDTTDQHRIVNELLASCGATRTC